mgnify:CR=1 FL=1
MNLVQTVAKILGRDVSEDEAKEFALNQYGVLTTFNREWEKKVTTKAETLVFICDTSDFEEETGQTIDGYLEVESWDGTEDKAKAFTKFATEIGRVYTIKTFETAVNDQTEDNLSNSFIFITNNY